MNDVRSAFSVHRVVLQRDVNVLLADVQALLRDAAALTGEQAGQAREQFKARLEALQLRLRELQAQGRDQVRDLADAGEAYVQSHPWRALGAAAAVAAVCGVLVAMSVSRRD
ncbi:DUF883 family protein [Cupriavidus basilensis]|uniref:Putative transmembrane protein n=1 Tax=Cupriavidus basilensis TaxID=68895 RepID=A0A0C4YEZ9_9BURK|nr:DUF883 family protein [Cupriavidus basilensis]AJG19336.1 putative transmembrane protein [Cupriavidus basilensis]